jgi:hypothetical protein
MNLGSYTNSIMLDIFIVLGRFDKHSVSGTGFISVFRWLIVIILTNLLVLFYFDINGGGDGSWCWLSTLRVFIKISFWLVSAQQYDYAYHSHFP